MHTEERPEGRQARGPGESRRLGQIRFGTAIVLAAAVVCVLPTQQIKLGAAQLNGIVGSASYAPDFTVTSVPTSETIARGGSNTTTVTVTPLNNFTGTVALTLSGVPAGTNAWIIPASDSLADGYQKNSTLYFCVGSSTAPGAYTVVVTGKSGTLTHTASVTLTVQ